MPDAMNDTDQLVSTWMKRYRTLAWTCDLRDMVLLHYAIPARRLRKIVPDVFRLETFVDSGIDMGFLSMGLFELRRFRPLRIGVPSSDFNQITFRTYVRYRNRPGLFFLRTELSPGFGATGQALIARNAVRSRIHHQGNRWVSSGPDGMTTVSYTQLGTETSRNWFPFRTREDAIEFLTHRLLGYFPTRAGVLGTQAVAHGRIHPATVEINEARIEPLERTGLLHRREAIHPFLATHEPQVRFLLLPPFPATWVPAERERPFSDLEKPAA